jgi:crotonobetaine/carnitine-CoA ligase
MPDGVPLILLADEATADGTEHLAISALPSTDALPRDATIGPGDPLCIFYTSGTTGRSKGVVLPNNYAYWHAHQRIRLFGLSPDDRWYTCLPLYHINALFITVISCWVAGAQVVLGRRFSASRYWEDVYAYQVTGLNLVGTMPKMLLNQPADPRDGQHNVRLALCNPPRDPPRDAVEEFERRFRLNCRQSLGMTEASPILMEPEHPAKHPTLGQAIAGREVRVVDEHDREVPDGTVGEIVFRPTAPYSMMLEYYKQPTETLAAFRNLWFHGGDLVMRDADGYFTFAGRKKDAFRRRGENISAFEVEAAVASHPAVAEATAIAVPADLGEDDVKVVAVLRPSASVTPEDLVAHCAARLADFAVPRYIEFAAGLPKTSTERVEKYKLQADWKTATTWDRVQGGWLGGQTNG